MCAHAKSLHLCPILFIPMDCSPPGSSVHGILQARILEWVVNSSSRGSSPAKDRTCNSEVSCIGRWVLYHKHHWGSPCIHTQKHTHTHTHTHISLQGKKIQGITKIIFGHKGILGKFPGSPAVKTPSFHCRMHGFNPWLENMYSVSQMVWPKILINKNLGPTIQHRELYSKLSNDLYQKRI